MQMPSVRPIHNQPSSQEEKLQEVIDYEMFLIELPPEKRRFARAYALYRAVGKAAKAAGIGPDRAKKFLQDEDVKKAIVYEERIAAYRHTLGMDYIIRELRKIVENDKVRPRDKIEALSLMSRVLGLEKPAQQTQQNLVVVKIDGLK